AATRSCAVRVGTVPGDRLLSTDAMVPPNDSTAILGFITVRSAGSSQNPTATPCGLFAVLYSDGPVDDDVSHPGREAARVGVVGVIGHREVAPFLWTPDRLGRWVPRKESTCRSHVRRTRRSSGPRWCAWSGRVAHLRSSLGSSSRQPSASVTGSSR